MMHRFFGRMIGLILFTASAAMAENPTYRFIGDNSILELMPEAKTAPAPSWLKPGMRLVYYSEAATVPEGEIGNLIQSANGPLHDPVTGKSWQAVKSEGPAGHGYTQLDVIAVHDDVVVVDCVTYGLDGMTQGLHVISTDAITTPPGYCGDWWINADVLKKHAAIKGPDVLSARLPWDLDGKKYDAFWLSTKTTNGATYTYTDVNSGRLLHSGIATSVQGNTVKINGVSTNVGGKSGYSLCWLRDVRQLQIPWAGAALPPSIAHARKLSFKGAVTTTLPNGPALSSHFVGELAIIGHGPDFLEATRSSSLIDGIVRMPFEPPTNVVSGCNQLAPLAIPIEHLAHLKVGQVLDSDPITKFVTNVVAVQPQVVLRQSQGRDMTTTDYAYDRTTGLISEVTTTIPTSFLTVTQLITGVE